MNLNKKSIKELRTYIRRNSKQTENNKQKTTMMQGTEKERENRKMGQNRKLEEKIHTRKRE